MITMKSIWRLSPEERRHDWFKRHHRLAENLFAAPLGEIAHDKSHAPHLDSFCAPKNSQGMLGWMEPWNHSAWVVRDYVQLANTGRWWPDETAKPQGLEEKSFDPQLFTMLKDLRFRIAKKDGVPPYIVFSNKVLESLVRYMPSSIEEGLAIPGIGEGKAQTYLPSFLEMIRTYRAMR
jgi:superfamily II DNA helicase RecQ